MNSIITINGFIICERCNGGGKLHNVNGSISSYIVCKSSGIRKPTWTEIVVYKNRLKTCLFNEIKYE